MERTWDAAGAMPLKDLVRKKLMWIGSGHCYRSHALQSVASAAIC
jgi:hypothetical protein